MLDMQTFSGMRPKVDPLLMEQDDASNARAIVLGYGALEPEVQPTAEGTTLTTAAGIPTSIYLIKGTSGSYAWLGWVNDVDVVKSPVAQASDGRICYSGDTKPRTTDYTNATSSGTDFPKTFYKLGIDVPATAASLSVSGGSGTNETRAYVYTFVSAWGEEGPPSSALTATGFANGTWNFNGMATAAPAETQVATKRIYRTVSGSSTTTYFFVAEVSLATANYADVVATSALGEAIPSIGWIAPTSTTIGFVEMPGGIIAGFDGNEVCFCQPYQPHAWPTAYRIALPYTIVALGVFGENLVVATKGFPYIISGSDPTTMGITKLDSHEPCVSKRSIVSFGNEVVYCSPNGLIGVSVMGARNITETVFSRDQWQKMIGFSSFGTSVTVPTVKAARYRTKYLFRNSAGNGFCVIDWSTGKPCFHYGPLVRGGVGTVEGFFINIETEDQTYFVDDLKAIYVIGWAIAGWDADFQPQATQKSYMQSTWKSKRFKLPKPASLAYLRVEADLSNAHAAYLTQQETQAANALITVKTDRSPVGALAVGDAAIGEGSPVLIFAPGNTAAGVYQQGYVLVTITAGNSGGEHADGMDALALVDSLYVPGGYPIAIAQLGKFDTWQVEVDATCRVKRVQLSETPQELG